MSEDREVKAFDFHEAVAEWLQKYGQVDDVAEVTKVEQEEVYGGYCSTCATYEVNLLIYYMDNEGAEMTFPLRDKYMSEFIKELVRTF